MSFSDERSMVCCFTMHLQEVSSPWGIIRLETEFCYQRGRADVVAVLEEGTAIAFEAKLKRWKDALRQAYRNLCFSDASFVVMPQEIASQIESFRHRPHFDTVFGSQLYRDSAGTPSTYVDTSQSGRYEDRRSCLQILNASLIDEPDYHGTWHSRNNSAFLQHGGIEELLVEVTR